MKHKLSTHRHRSPWDSTVLAEAPTWWNVQTRDGALLYSSLCKSRARLYQKIANRLDWTDGRIADFIREAFRVR